MEIDYRSDNSLVIKDDTKELSFLDLAKIKGYKLEGIQIITRFYISAEN